MELHPLEAIGLSKAEIKVYTTLLKIGPAGTGVISKETDLRKSTIYESLHRLCEKGLVGYYTTDGVKQFQAANPDKIIDYIDEKKKEADENREKIKRLLPQLQQVSDFKKPSAEAHIFQGIEGFKTMRKDVLKKSQGELLLLGAISREDKVLPVFYHQWNQERIKQGIKFRILHKRSTYDSRVARTALMEIRYLPPEINNPVVINIYGDRVVSMLWKEKYPLCFMIINREMADAYRKYFELLWRRSKPH